METETMQLLLAAVVGGVIVPVVAGIKKTVIVKWVRPEFLTAVLAVLAAWGVSAWLVPGMETAEIIRQALAAVGGTSLVYGTVKISKGGSK